MFRYLLTGSALLCSTALGCGEQGETSAADPIEREAVPESQYKPTGLEDTIDVLAGEIDRAEAAELRLGVALGSGSAEWDLVGAGVERAYAELGAQGVVETADEVDQLDFVKREREDAANGIGVAPLASSLETEVERARAGGIPVVTIENDLASERELFVGFGQTEIGQSLADIVIQATGLRIGSAVILGVDDETSDRAGYLRSMAAKSVMEEAGLDVVIRNSSTADDGEARDIEVLKQDLLASPRPLAVLGVLETSYRVALAAVEAERALADAEPSSEEPEETTGLVQLRSVPFVAYGMAPATMDALRAGVLHATLTERRHYMGYVVPYVLAGFSLLGVERTKYILTPHLLEDGTLDVGVDVIRAEDLDAYLEFQELLDR